MKHFENMTIHFYIWDEEVVNDFDDTTGDIVEVNEEAFLASNDPIEYKRYTVFENGVKQICLTKMPKF